MQLTKEIEVMLKDDLQRGRQLFALLEQETIAVKQRNFVLIENLLNEKTPLMAQLKTNGLKRQQWLDSVKKTHPKADWSYILEQLHLEHLSLEWAQVKEVMRQCQEINTINGQLLHRGINSNERLLKILQGNTQDDELYNAKGLQRSYNKAIAAYACA